MTKIQTIVTIEDILRESGLYWSVAIRLTDIHSPKRMMINVEFKRGVSADGIVYYDPNEAIKLAIAYMLDEMEKEVKK